jgi:aminoglycoside phosphotransferase (APT) family kinase protein
VDLRALANWLDETAPGSRQGELRAQIIAGGRSNLTYHLTDGISHWALRRPPLGHVLPTAHDMAREYRVISALGPTAVPVPDAIALCTDRAVLGEPFYLMSFVAGTVLDDPAVVADRAVARRTTEQLVDTLVALHKVDPVDVGLGDFGRPDGYLERQVRRWHKQFLASINEAWPPPGDPLADLVATVADRLLASLPTSGPTGIVHGDYRLTNVMFRPDLSQIDAVLDWEMATLGDTLTDVGLLYVYHDLSSATRAVMPEFSADKGFLGPEELMQRYATASGTDLDSLDWYIAFGFFKLSVIAAGIHARFLQGLTVGEGFEQFGLLVDLALDGARNRLGGQ